MLDCGLGKETVVRLARLGRAPEDVTAIVVTHESTTTMSVAWMAFQRRHCTPGG